VDVEWIEQLGTGGIICLKTTYNSLNGNLSVSCLRMAARACGLDDDGQSELQAAVAAAIHKCRSEFVTRAPSPGAVVFNGLPASHSALRYPSSESRYSDTSPQARHSVAIIVAPPASTLVWGSRIVWDGKSFALGRYASYFEARAALDAALLLATASHRGGSDGAAHPYGGVFAMRLPSPGLE